MPSDACDEHVDSEGDDAPASTRQDAKSDGGEPGQPQVVAAAKDAPGRPVKRARRGRYISRACTSCQQRKIKCEGGDPCAQCVAKKRVCVPTWRGGRPEPRQNPETDEGAGSIQDSADSPANRHVLARLAALERQLRLMQNGQGPSPRHTPADDQPSADLQDALETDGQTFAGELSMTPAFDNENGSIDGINTTSTAPTPTSSNGGTTFMPTWTRSTRAMPFSTRQQSGIPSTGCGTALLFGLPQTVQSAGMLPPAEIARCDRGLLIWLEFIQRWNESPPRSDGDEQHGYKVSGRGAGSVLYLFRLDANQQAAQVMGIIVSIAHTMRIHRQGTVEKMPAFHNQLCCRTWWAIYLLDRRIAIESGMPYLIQDSNIDTALPIDLSEDWMTQFATRKERIADLQQEIAAELARDRPPSAIPYTIAMVRYARVAGQAWQVLYSAKTPAASMTATVRHLDSLLGELLDTAPRHLRYGAESEAQFRTSLRWQAKQTLIHFTSCTYLRLLIRRPFLLHSRTLNPTEDDEATACASLATGILSAHQNIKDNGLKYGFALSHYVTSCTMVMLGLVSKEPGFNRRYGDLVLAATHSLNVYCRKSWVSGKMTRLVSRLTQLVQRTLANNARRGSGIDNQPTPRPEELEACRIPANTAAPNVDTNELNSASIDARSGSQIDQWPNSFSYTPAASSGEVEVLRATSSSWMTRLNAGNQVDWIMPDFNFEAMGDTNEYFASNDPGFSRLSDSERRDTVGGNTQSVERGFNESRLAALGLNGVVGLDLDMDVDLSVMDLWGASPMLDFDVLQ
ncbi:hypothetical protein AK830_g8612 [Neonectria ditissima]|uniref:Zn(2)-C6 fungal-type domain-containing protein n=1 Tax=Neonectria ditissima TaxID=78410 RepID=A0A0P7ATZ7_9HYPO|nr:hypothetical protein AK830_g8612 [Neonectria ditissima]